MAFLCSHLSYQSRQNFFIQLVLKIVRSKVVFSFLFSHFFGVAMHVLHVTILGGFHVISFILVKKQRFDWQILLLLLLSLFSDWCSMLIPASWLILPKKGF